MSEPIPLFMPEITDDDRAAVDAVLRSGRMGLGDAVHQFEALFAARVTRPYAIATGSLGTGLRIALTACGIGPGHEVIVPAFGPVVIANAVTFTGARPVFADVDPRTLNATPSTVEALVTERTRAIVASANFGNPHGADALAHLCSKFEIPLIENATETLGCQLGREPAGRFGRIAIFGLPAGGIVVGGDASVLVTHDDILANACRSLRDAGRPYADPEEGLPPEVGRLQEHERFGFDSRMDELRAALAHSQVKRIDRSIEIRAKIADHYVRRLGGVSDLMLPTLPEGCVVAWPGYVVRLTESYLADDRDLIIRGLHRHDIGATNPYPVAPLMPFHAMRWGHRIGDFPVAERMSARTIALPFHHGLDERDIDLVCQTIELMLKRQNFRR
ncbi:MAG: DegT/DnrJ/EryC1/StrS aminotransferase family protein [Phycisphaerae bacterium]|nr:DegT/DnrJ/EryC1/StrS aminotransferase family protein [Phycisphaerae bacterium]